MNRYYVPRSILYFQRQAASLLRRAGNTSRAKTISRLKRPQRRSARVGRPAVAPADRREPCSAPFHPDTRKFHVYKGVIELFSHRDDCASRIVSSFVVGDSNDEAKTQSKKRSYEIRLFTSVEWGHKWREY